MAKVKIKVVVPARQRILSTGIFVNTSTRLTFKFCDEQRWTDNPSSLPVWVPPTGRAGQAAPSEYVLPGAPQGALVGYILGGQKSLRDEGLHKFQVQNDVEQVVTYDGELILTINDDYDGQLGNGYLDNDGAVSVDVLVEI